MSETPQPSNPDLTKIAKISNFLMPEPEDELIPRFPDDTKYSRTPADEGAELASELAASKYAWKGPGAHEIQAEGTKYVKQAVKDRMGRDLHPMDVVLLGVSSEPMAARDIHVFQRR